MNFNEYQKFTKKTDAHSAKQEKELFGGLLFYPTLGIAGESGELANKVKKIFRDKGGKLDKNSKHEIVLELGDILWYVAKMSRALGIKFDDVARLNIKKLTSRKKRGVIQGHGDHR